MDRKRKLIETKSEVKDFEKNEVILKISAFNNKDSHFDIIRDKAFNRTIKNNIKNIKHIIEHGSSFYDIIGGAKEFEVRDDGLFVTSKINTSIENGKFAMNQFKFFAENEMNIGSSIGYDLISTQPNDELMKEAQEYFGSSYPYYAGYVGRDITEVKLIEYSTVFYPSNDQANEILIKSDMDLKEFVYKFLTESKITVERIDQLKSLINNHVKNTPITDPSITPISNKDFAQIILTKINN